MFVSRFYACALLLTLSASAATIPDLQITPLPIGSPPTFTTSAVAPDPENPDVFWFTDLAFQQIGSLNRRTGAVVQHSLRPPNGDTIQPGAAQQALAFGADGKLWFGAVRNIATAPQSVIGRFDRATGARRFC